MKLSHGVADLVANQVKITSRCQRIQMTFDRAIKAYLYPTEGQHLSELGDLTSQDCLKDIRQRMLQHPVGRQILEEKPRVTEETFPIKKLLELDKESFGYAYGQFMSSKGFSSDERPKAKYFLDLELAYVYQRYKEIHDFIHVILAKEVSIHDEIVVKWYEMASLGLPSATLSATVGMLKLSTQERKLLINDLGRLIKAAQSGEFIMNIYFEKEIKTPLDEIRRRIKIF